LVSGRLVPRCSPWFHGAFFESVVLLQVEMSAVRCAVLGEREEVAGQGLQPGSVGLDDDLSAQVADLDA
jgi:hypothetical protein